MTRDAVLARLRDVRAAIVASELATIYELLRPTRDDVDQVVWQALCDEQATRGLEESDRPHVRQASRLAVVDAAIARLEHTVPHVRGGVVSRLRGALVALDHEDDARAAELIAAAAHELALLRARLLAEATGADSAEADGEPVS